MQDSARIGSAVGPAQLSVGVDGRIYRSKFPGKLIVLAVAAIVCGSLFGFTAFGFTARAGAGEAAIADDDYLALRDYVQSIGAAQRAPVGAQETQVTRFEFDDDPYSALRDFVSRLGTSQPASVKSGKVRVAEADNALDALREFFQKRNDNQPKSTPAKMPKAPAPTAVKPKGPAAEATYIGTKVCLTCHTSQAESFGHTLMGRLAKQGKLQCESCHGAGSAHAKAGGGRGVGGIVSFRSDDPSRTAEENNGICLGCHERGDRSYWNGSTHETRGVACTSCHTVMKAVSRKSQLKTAAEPQTCFQCHKDRRAQMFRSSHMPLREGKMVCSNCHNPHGSATEALLRESSVNANCYKCHAEKRGPFLFEHTPVRENCATCHDPHGSVNEHLLKISRPRLCAECHTVDHGPAIANGPRVVQGFGRACQNCHTKIHGSNSPAGALLLR